MQEISATWVFVASDHDHMIPELEFFLKKERIHVARLSQNRPIVDLAILSKANLFIGNCFSSFSAFVKRQRDVEGLRSNFWAFKGRKTEEATFIRDEL